MEKADWEKKDMRMGWMNCFTNTVSIISANIEAGIYKPKNNEKTFEEVAKYHEEMFRRFLEMDVGIAEKPDQVTPPESKCEKCGAKVSLTVEEFSVKQYGKVLCYKCQKANAGLP